MFKVIRFTSYLSEVNFGKYSFYTQFKTFNKCYMILNVLFIFEICINKIYHAIVNTDVFSIKLTMAIAHSPYVLWLFCDLHKYIFLLYIDFLLIQINKTNSFFPRLVWRVYESGLIQLQVLLPRWLSLTMYVTYFFFRYWQRRCLEFITNLD